MSDISVIEQEYDPAIEIALLRPHPANPKLHAKEVIREGIETLGFFGAVYVQRSTNFILAGHGRVETLQDAGVLTVPGFWMDVDDDTAEKILLIDNRAPEAGGFDRELLASLLAGRAEAGDLLGTGYTPDDVDDLLAHAGGSEFTIPETEFQGGYVEDPDEAKHRAERQSTTKASVGLREIVLVYQDEDYNRVRQAIQVIADFHTTENTSETVKVALLQYAEGLA